MKRLRFIWCFLVLFILAVSCSSRNSHGIKDVDGEYVHIHADGECIKFTRFKYNGHWYITTGGEYLFHSPDCDCQNKSTLFDW